MFSKDEPVVICEGITDQMFFKKFGSLLIINSFGWFNFPIYISCYYSLYKKYEDLRIIADGDSNLNEKESDIFKTKEYLEKILKKKMFFILKKILKKIFLTLTLLKAMKSLNY